jgi:hypothetical protein
VEKCKVMEMSRSPPLIQIMIDRTQLENVEYFNYFGSLTTNDALYTCKINQDCHKNVELKDTMTLRTGKLDLNLRKKSV